MPRTGFDEADGPDDGEPEELSAWLSSGYDREDAEVWRRWRFTLAQADAWRHEGVGDGLLAAQWQTSGATPDTVRDFTYRGQPADYSIDIAMTSSGPQVELIDQRRSEDAQGPDVLTLLLGAEHEDGSPMSPAELRDELVTALVAGHETTASQLAWGFDLLAHHSQAQARLARELEEDPDVRILTNIVGAAPSAITVGMPVEVTFEDRDGAALPVFRPC